MKYKATKLYRDDHNHIIAADISNGKKTEHQTIDVIKSKMAKGTKIYGLLYKEKNYKGNNVIQLPLKAVAVHRFMDLIDGIEINDGNMTSYYGIDDVVSLFEGGFKIQGLSYQNGIVKEHVCGSTYKKKIDQPYLKKLLAEINRLEAQEHRTEKNEEKLKRLQKRWIKLRDDDEFHEMVVKVELSQKEF